MCLLACVLIIAGLGLLVDKSQDPSADPSKQRQRDFFALVLVGFLLVIIYLLFRSVHKFASSSDLENAKPLQTLEDWLNDPPGSPAARD